MCFISKEIVVKCHCDFTNVVFRDASAKIRAANGAKDFFTSLVHLPIEEMRIISAYVFQPSCSKTFTGSSVSVTEFFESSPWHSVGVDFEDECIAPGLLLRNEMGGDKNNV